MGAATLTDDELLEALRTALLAAETDLNDAARRCQRYGAALDAMGEPYPIKPAAPRPTETRPKPETRPKAPPATPAKSGKSTPVDYAEVAKVADRLRSEGKPMQAGLAKHFGVPTTTTNNWITKCRKLGLLGSSSPTVTSIPADEDDLPTPQSPASDLSFSIDDARAAIAGTGSS